MLYLINLIFGKNRNVNQTTIDSRIVNDLSKTKKTRGFTNLDHSRDKNFGELIKELSKV